MAAAPPTGPQPSLITHELLGVAIAFPILSTIAVILRFVAIGTQKHKPTAAEWTIVAALLCTWGISFDIYAGAHDAGVDTTNTDPLTAAVVFLKVLFVDGFLLSPAVGLVKVSILLFYRRIFETPAFRTAVNVLLAMVSAWMISSFFCILFSSSPVSAAWDPIHSHFNIDFYAWSLSFAVLGLAFDVAVFAMPLFMVSRLNMSTRRKLQVMGIFWLGAFCVVCAAVRLYYLNEGEKNVTSLDGENRYVYITTGFLWGCIEPNVSIITACLPTYAPFLTAKGFSMASYFRSFRGLFSSRGTSGSRSRSGKSRTDFANSETRGYSLGSSDSARGFKGESQALEVLETRSFRTDVESARTVTH